MSTNALAKSEREKEKLLARMRRMRQESNATVKTGLQIGIGMGAAYGTAYAEKRWGDKTQVAGQPLSLVVGGSLTILGALGVAGAESDIVQAAGQGALMAFAASKGGDAGTEAAAAA